MCNFQKIIKENHNLFKTFLDYGRQEELYLTNDEVEEISTVFQFMIKNYEGKIEILLCCCLM